jgi:hypothetical protein
MQLNITNVLLVILGIVLILCFILMIMNDDNNIHIEAFDPVVDAIQQKLQSESPAQLKSTIKTLQQRLIDYGYAPDLNNYVSKTELNPNSGKCLVSKAEDRDKYISKSDVPSPGPRIDLSQYVKKSSIPPQKVCPPPPEIDYSAYVKKSTLPPNEKCPPCIAPKVKVSAGLCRECPPAPVCPPPERCPELKCPPPAPCPTKAECTPCDEIRYIKVPTVITKTVMVDASGNVISQQINSGNANANANANPNANSNANLNSIINSNANSTTPTQPLTPYVSPTQIPTQQIQPVFTQPAPMPTQSLLDMLFNSGTQIPSTTFPAMSINLPNTTLAQTLDNNDSNALCPSADLNSEFKKYGIYGI